MARPKGTCSTDGCERTAVARGLCMRCYDQQRRSGGYSSMPPTLTTADHFWAQVDRRKPDECWPWTGYIRPSGYAAFTYPPDGQHAYVYAYELHYGPVPDGHTVDHLCHTTDCTVPSSECPHRACCNPAHLTATTSRENVLRGNGPTAENARKTHCKNGHPFDEANTSYCKNGSRRCKTCHRQETRRRRGQPEGT